MSKLQTLKSTLPVLDTRRVQTMQAGSYITAHRAAANARVAAGQCAPDTSALDLLAELQRRADERAGELARIAYEARGRGWACEGSYDASHALIQAERLMRDAWPGVVR
ncbi:MAG: DUF2514 family protein [Pseudomonadales bacterium]|jgi:hypothetical protein|nr:hypothetical protein CHL79_22730 [Delftia acidovorans]